MVNFVSEKQACHLAMVNMADFNNDSDSSSEKDIYKPS
jgi:hypothetical protein